MYDSTINNCVYTTVCFSRSYTVSCSVWNFGVSEVDKKTIYYTQETIRQTANLLASGHILHAAATVKNTFVSLADTESFFSELSKFAYVDELDDLKDLVKTLFGG